MRNSRTRPTLRRVVAVTLASIVLASCGGSSGDAGPLDEGREVYGSRCSTCHGNRGQGGIGPAFDTVVSTFPACQDQIKWITLGSERWQAEVGPTYGATDKPIEQVMPSMEAVLSSEQIAAVAAFERSQYGGLEPDEALAGCGFAVPDTAP